MKTSFAAIDLIREYEGLRLEAYRRDDGSRAIGYGHSGDVRAGDRITEHQAEVILAYDLEALEPRIARLAPTANANQFSAFVALAYSIGFEAFAASRLLRIFNEGNPLTAAHEFDQWAYVGTDLAPGLVIRRVAEKALFLSIPS